MEQKGKRGREGKRARGINDVSVHLSRERKRERATCTLNDKRRPLSTIQCEKWLYAADETIRCAPTTSRYDNIAESFRVCVCAHTRAHDVISCVYSRTAGCYLLLVLLVSSIRFGEGV